MSGERVVFERIPASELRVGDRFIDEYPTWPVEQILHDSANWTHIDGADSVWEIKSESTVLRLVSGEVTG